MNDASTSVTMPKTLDHVRITESASQQSILRRYVNSSHNWIEHKFGCRMDEALPIECDESNSRAKWSSQGLLVDRHCISG
jgi:hypothetical protein